MICSRKSLTQLNIHHNLKNKDKKTKHTSPNFRCFFCLPSSRSRIFTGTKRTLDLGFSGAGLLLCAPLLLALTAANWLIMGRPVFLRQERWGRGGKIFLLLKFRSMTLGTGDPRGRLTPYGRWLRKYSLDELPSLWNVLRGDLTLVGPRPLMTSFYCPDWRHQVRPGLTGLAQIMGRNAISWRKKFRYDLFYIQQQSLALDCWIVWKTIPLVYSAKGVDLAQPDDYFPKPEDDCKKELPKDSVSL